MSVFWLDALLLVFFSLESITIEALTDSRLSHTTLSGTLPYKIRPSLVMHLILSSIETLDEADCIKGNSLFFYN